jgi:hypothetical protein
MTLVSEIITDAFRQSNLLAIGATPTATQQAEALRYVNRIVMSVLGNEAGENLEAFALGGNNIEAPSGYPWYGETPWGDWYLPMNKRIMLNLTDAATVPLYPVPCDGARFAVVDTSNNLSTYNLTVQGNGRTIEGATSLVLNTDGLVRQWFFREDLGNWMRVTDLELTDEFPFPVEFDQMFITLLAMSMNPAYGVMMDAQLANLFNRSRTQFRARYHNTIQTNAEHALLRLSGVYGNSRYYAYNYLSDPETVFDRGYPW